jgi:hypothetical protein
MSKNPISEESPTTVDVQSDLETLLMQSNADGKSILRCERQPSNQEKWTIAFMAGILFLIISSPFLYGVVNRITSYFGVKIIENNGSPNITGMVLHAVVFIIVVKYLMK